MAALKSKHIELIKDAVEDVSNLRADVGRVGPALKALSAAATAAAKAADTAEKSYKDQLGYCEKIISNYATKVNEIADLEEQYRSAKGDKKAEAEIEKKHKKADAQADVLRKDYNTAVQVFETLSDVIDATVEAFVAAAEKVEGFSAAAARS